PQNSVPSRLAQHQIDDPTAADVRGVRIAAVVKNGGVFAAGVLQGIGQDWHRGEVARVVNLLREGDDGGGAPLGGEGDGAEGAIEEVAQQLTVTTARPVTWRSTRLE